MPTELYVGSMAIRDRMNEIAPDDPAIAGLSVAAWLEASTTPDRPRRRSAR